MIEELGQCRAEKAIGGELVAVAHHRHRGSDGARVPQPARRRPYRFASRRGKRDPALRAARAASRSHSRPGWFVPDRQDPSGRRVLMLDNGGNVVPLAPALAYTIEDRGGGPRVVWSDALVPINVDQVLRMKSGPPAVPEPTSRSTACDGWLRSFLVGGMKPATEILKAANEAGFSKNQIRRARSRIGAVARKEGLTRTLNGAGSCEPSHPTINAIRRWHAEAIASKMARR